MLSAVGALLVAAVFLLVQQHHDIAVTGLLGLVSALTLLGWLLTAWVAHEISKMDEDQLYDGGDRGWVVIFLPAGLTALWLLLFITLLASRAVLREWPIFSQAIVWDAKLFGSATAIGLLLVVMGPCFPRFGPCAAGLLLAAALAAFALSTDLSQDQYCGADDCYSTLGVERDASPSALKQAFRRRSLACFPEEMVCSAEEFAAVQISYDVLSSSLREAYDAYLLCRTRRWELLCRAGLGWARTQEVLRS